MAERSDRFARWQKLRIDQLGYAVNLILGFTVATLGYWFSILRDRDFCPRGSAKCVMWLSLGFLIASGIAGVWCVVNRLWDFRGTAMRAGQRPGAPSKEYLGNLGKRTWCLFWIQLAFFCLGILALAAALLLTYYQKLI